MHEDGLDNITLKKEILDLKEQMEKMKEENIKEKKELKKKTALHKFALKET